VDRESYNPNDPGFLLSRRIDRDLSPDDGERLEACLRASPQLRRNAEQLEAVSRLVARWAQRRADIDADVLAKLTHAQTASHAADADLARVDRLLHRWGADPGTADEVDLTARVLDQIRSRRLAAPVRRLVFRLGVPLAAAAAVAIAVVGTMWFPARPQAVCQVTLADSTSQSISTREAPQVVVSFAPFVAETPLIETGPVMGYMTLGAENVPLGDEGSSL